MIAIIQIDSYDCEKSNNNKNATVYINTKVTGNTLSAFSKMQSSKKLK